MSAENDISFLFDTDISHYTVGNIKQIYETTWFNLVLHGLRTSFNRVIQSSSPIEFAFTDRYKELLLSKANGNPQYPYAFIVVNDIDIVKDEINTGAMARRGIVMNRLAGDSAPVSHLFPFKMNITLNVLDSDVNSLFSIVQSIFLSDVCRGFNYGIKAFDLYTRIKVTKTGGISFGEATISTEQENDYGSGHITETFEVHGWMGFTSLHPTVKQLNVNVHTLNKPLVDGENVDAQLSAETLNFTYTLKVSEDADGKEHIDKFFVTNSR